MNFRRHHHRPPPPEELPPENPPLEPEYDEPLLDEEMFEVLCVYDTKEEAREVDIILYDENPAKDSLKLSVKLFLQ